MPNITSVTNPVPGQENNTSYRSPITPNDTQVKNIPDPSRISRADQRTDRGALTASGQRADPGAGNGSSAAADRSAFTRRTHVLKSRATGHQQCRRQHGGHRKFSCSHIRRNLLRYLSDNSLLTVGSHRYDLHRHARLFFDKFDIFLQPGGKLIVVPYPVDVAVPSSRHSSAE